jgi:hypothetical protein
MHSSAYLLLPLFLLSSCGDAPQPTVKVKPADTPALQNSVAQFQRGRLAIPSAYGATGRSLQPSTAEDAAAVDQALGQISNRSTLADIERVLSTVRHLESAEILRLVRALLEHPEADVRLTALTLVEGCNDITLMPLVEQSLADPADEVRLEALELAQHLSTPTLEPLLQRSLADSNPNARQLALHSALKQGAAVKERLLDAASSSPDPQLANAALAFTEATPSKGSIQRFFQALDHPSASVRTSAREMLTLTFHQDFSTAKQAQAWWKIHATAFNDDLVLTDVNLATQLARGKR